MLNSWKRILISICVALALSVAPVGPFKCEAVSRVAFAAARDPVRATHGMVATTNRIATWAAADSC
jgi:hypothetical protein